MNAENTKDSYFEPMGKIPRLNREIIVTEKIDGSNAQVLIWDADILGPPLTALPCVAQIGTRMICAGSRNRWLSVGQDNYGFASWVRAHAEELNGLGPGRHFGEWWGKGINRAYGLIERRFSLFNVSRWDREVWEVNQSRKAEMMKNPPPYEPFVAPPSCCGVVPVLYRGPFSQTAIDDALNELKAAGSAAADGYPHPEGIVVFHCAASQLFKVTIENDASPKSVCN